MTVDEIERLKALADKATPAPWHVFEFDDAHCMSGVAITTKQDLPENFRMDAPAYSETIAMTLLQEPRYICHKTGGWGENAELIIMLRNNASELLRLAKLGLQAEAKLV